MILKDFQNIKGLQISVNNKYIAILCDTVSSNSVVIFLNFEDLQLLTVLDNLSYQDNLKGLIFDPWQDTKIFSFGTLSIKKIEFQSL